MRKAEADPPQGHAGPRVFNGAALFQVRKAGVKSAKCSRITDSSMGPHFFKCGKNAKETASRHRAAVFNGAALFQVRKAWTAWRFRMDFTSSSMGPHFFKCGKRKSKPLCSLGLLVFNGAALFQVRKAQIHDILGVESFSSMGPHFFKCGKKPPPILSACMHACLQWGRTFSSAERGDDAAWDLIQDALQWGRTFSSAERNPPVFLVSEAPLMVFNGAALFQVRKEKERRNSGRWTYSSSMGPHFFKCGKASGLSIKSQTS